jgi:very-short-patch-repair endonuclease
MNNHNLTYYISKFKKIFLNKYDYSKNNTQLCYKYESKIKIICPIHGEFIKTISCHLRGGGCNACRKKQWSEYLIQIKKRHNNKYTYDDKQDLPNGNKTKIKIKCPKHGIFYQLLTHHLNGVGCPECSYDYISEKNSKSFIQHIEDCKKVHNNFYTYPDNQFLNPREYTKIKIEIICPIHGSFFQIIRDHKNNRGCPLCNESKGEKKVRIFLEKHDIKYHKEHIFQNCKNENNIHLKFDFYLYEHNVCIEYDGEHHYKPPRYSKNKEKMISKLTVNKKHDNIKNIYCFKNNINLIRIPYWEFKNVEKILKQQLTSLNVSLK